MGGTSEKNTLYFLYLFFYLDVSFLYPGQKRQRLHSKMYLLFITNVILDCYYIIGAALQANKTKASITPVHSPRSIENIIT